MKVLGSVQWRRYLFNSGCFLVASPTGPRQATAGFSTTHEDGAGKVATYEEFLASPNGHQQAQSFRLSSKPAGGQSVFGAFDVEESGATMSQLRSCSAMRQRAYGLLGPSAGYCRPKCLAVMDATVLQI